MGDTNRGQTAYEAQCQLCHGTRGILAENGGDAINSLTVGKYSLATLTRKIDEEMPLGAGSPTDCVGQCAADIAAYLQTWLDGPVVCDPNKTIGYTPRALRLLTIDEYQNTLEDLLGITEDYRDDIVNDNTKGKFPNNGTANVDESRVNKFWNVANDIAVWAVANNQPFACLEGNDCATPFVEGFAYRLFRRPLSQAEHTFYEDIFGQYPGAEGMEIALTSALNSPHFLYRSELGRRVADVLSGADIVPEYVPVEPITVLAPSDFGSGSIENGYKKIPLYGSIGKTISNYTFTGHDVLKIRIRGTFSDGSWPTMLLRVDNKEIDTIEIDHTGVRTLTYELKDINGSGKYIQIENKNTGAHSQERFLFIGDMTLGHAELQVPSKGDEDKLRAADQDAFVLTPYEYATALSYILTGSAPDDTLLAAAENGGLDYEPDIRAQVERLLDTPRGRERIGAFAGYWFNTDRIVTSDIDRDPALFPTYTMDVRESMAEEVRELFRTVFYDASKPFESFYSGDFTALNSTLADYYGISAPTNSPDNWVVVDNLDKRGGILTTGAFMTVNAHPDKTSPIFRAVRLREQMLCQHLDPPPLLEADRQHLLELAQEEERTGIATTRRYYEVITDSIACDGCHEKQINPLFGMEDFDQVGRWRDTQKGSTGMTLDIDNSGILYGPYDVTDLDEYIPFNGAKELSKILAGLPGTQECLIRNSFRFVAGMPISDVEVDSSFESPLTSEQKVDFACASDKASNAFIAAGNSPRAVITELVMQDLIRFRK